MRFYSVTKHLLKTQTMKKVIYFSGMILLLSGMLSCSKDSDKSTINISLTDAPGLFDALNVDIQGIAIIGDHDSVMLDVTPGIVNLLNFSNGIDTLIGTGSLEPGTVQQIRLILGSANTVTVNGATYPLSTPSAEQSGLKLQVHKTFEAGVEYSILLDFDANQSIVKQGSGSYKLKPVIRTIDTAISGSIKGTVSPAGTLATVVATADGVSYSTPVNPDGKFLLRGLPAGTYSISVFYSNDSGSLSVDIENIVVTIGNTTQMGTIIL